MQKDVRRQNRCSDIQPAVWMQDELCPCFKGLYLYMLMSLTFFETFLVKVYPGCLTLSL